MSEGDGLLDKRIQANISAELKAQIREMVDGRMYSSEADVVRTALHRLIEQDSSPTIPAPAPAPAPAVPTDYAELHHDLKDRLDLVAWLLTVSLTLMATAGSRILQGLTRERVDPMLMLDEALQTSVHEQDSTRRRLAAGWRAFKDMGRHA